MSGSEKAPEYQILNLGDKDKIYDGNIDCTGINEESRKIIEECVRNPNKFLGEGGAGKVFIFGQRCIKMMRNIKKLRGNPPEVEFRIQWLLRNLNVNGVFAPQPFRCLVGRESAAIIMQRLLAVNMLMVFQEQERLPANFDAEKFFDRLEDSNDEMHSIGIIHNDLGPRNIMIDIETGLPRVIDFGNALDYSKNRPPDFEKRVDVDNENLAKARRMMNAHLDNKNKKH